MLIHLETQADLDDAVHKLVDQDRRLRPILEVTGMPAIRQREPGFAGLAAIVCGQQLSTASAAAIWGASARRSIRSITMQSEKPAPTGLAVSACPPPRSRR